MTEESTARFVEEAAALQGLELGGDSLAAVLANVRILRAMAAEFADLPLPADLDPAALLRL
ncbi:MAG TPA: AtzG-like protein [Caulobacteraceae bacterium]|nr:AtzG-like protein [Caulobacteraceae bacterium]